MILEIAILLAAFPVGFFIRFITKEELEQGRPWFFILMIISLLGVIWFSIQGKYVFSFSLGFIGIVSLISFYKPKKGKL